MDLALSHEQELLVRTARAFVERELYPHEARVERTCEVPMELAAEIRRKAVAQGLYAANMPEELGGGGLDPVSLVLLERELGRASFALQAIVARPSNILRACTGEQVERYLLPTVRGERVECLALSEPEAGSDPRSMRTTARPDGGDWVVDGEKHFISHADVADYAILFAATGEEEGERGRRRRITAFLIDKATPGFEVRRGYRAVSHRGYHNAVLRLEGCRVPAGQVLGEPHRGFEVANTWLASTRLSVAAMCLGRAHRALELAIEWAASRRQFGQPIGRFQGVSFQLADMRLALHQAELLTLWAAWRDTRGELRDEDAAMAKLAASEMLGRVADAAVQIHGGMGLMEDLPLERIWRDARVERIWDGTSEIQRHIISRAMLRPLGS
jgi:acyl-CoA dehydrogenase